MNKLESWNKCSTLVLLNRYHCKECGYTSDNVAIDGKVTCFKCIE